MSISSGLELHSRVFPCQAILFDLDGTLVDTSEDLWLALQSALQEHGIEAIGRDQFFRTLHYGIEGSVALILQNPQALQASLARPGDPELLSKVVSSYKSNYHQLAHQNSPLYEGVADLLDKCRSTGLKLGICTNKEGDQTMDLLRTRHIDQFFDVVLGVDQVTQPKPSPAPLIQALEMLQLPMSCGLFVGDSELDAMASQAAGLPFLLHQQGFGASTVKPSFVDGSFDNYPQLKVV